MTKLYTIIIILFFCSSITSYGQNIGDIKLENLEINTQGSDFGGIEYKKNQLVFASSKRERSFIKRKWKPNQLPFLNLYTSKGNVAKPFSKTINNRYHQSSVAFTPDYKTIYFTSDRLIGGKLDKQNAEGKVVLNLYKATYADGKWGNIKLLPFNSHLFSTGHPSISKDGKKLYFTSDMPGSIGETDIYETTILGNDKYTTPKNLGAKINTNKKEMFPFIDAEGVLYFSSNGRSKNLGNLDVYGFNTLNNESDVFHLPEPINSVSDDFSFKYNSVSKSGYISSNREGGKGDDDIYAFYGASKSKLRNTCYNVISGSVIDNLTFKHLLDATVKLYTSEGVFVKELPLDNIGKFSYKKPCESAKNYIVKVNEQSYISATKTATVNIPLLVVLAKKKSVIEEVNPEKAKFSAKINNIYFDTNKSSLRKVALPRLDRLVKVMKEHPSVFVEMSAHTDYRGKSSHNMKLSKQRAKSTKEYLISKGISSTRVFAEGFGEERPFNNCTENVKCSKEKLEKNRRTEFLIKTKNDKKGKALIPIKG